MTRLHDWWSPGRTLARRRLLLAGAGAGLAAAFLSACGGGEQKPAPGAQATGPAGTTAAGAAATPQPKYGGTAVFNFGLEAPHLDVHQTTTLLLACFGPGAAYSRLFRYKIPPEVPTGVTAEVAPDLAQSLEQPDPTTIVVHLRPNARFHDIPPVSGRMATAEDVVVSYKRILGYKVNASLLPDTDTFEATDPTTIRVKLKRPDADALSTFAYFTNKIIAKELADKDLKQGPTIGTGPFQLVEWKPNEATTFKKNPNYFLSGLPYLDGYKWLRIADPSTQLSAFLADQITRLSTNVTPDVVKQIKSFGARYRVDELRDWFGNTFVNFDVSQPPFNDKRVREALFRATNHEQVFNTALQGAGYYAVGLTMPGMDWSLPDDELKQKYRFDLAQAKQLLAAAGSPELTIEAGVLNLSPQKEVFEQLQQQWKMAGIITKPTILDNVGYAGALNPQNRFPLLVGTSSPGPNPTLDLGSRFRTGGSRNGSHISDKTLDDLIEKQATTLDANERRKVLTDLQRYVLDNFYQLCFGQLTYRPYQAYFKGVTNVSTNEYESWTRAWIDRG
jgi:peptide/nickel transport system substrate-binding protein